GMSLLTDYRNHFEFPEFRGLPQEDRPYLMAADYAKAALDADLRNISRAARLGPPKFGFSDTEQEVMEMALRGLTDQGIAGGLGLSLVAIKKRWEGIYEKVNDESLRHFWEHGMEEPGFKMGRRQVLQMMAEHPEEFWPSNPKRRVGRSEK